MREIKFRAWLPNEETMLYSEKDLTDLMEIWNVGGSVCVKIQQTVWRERGGEPSEEVEYVLPEQIIMQFTGLRDRNGREIYELHEINNKYRVVYLFNRYILQDISNSDIFVEISNDAQYEITGEYNPMEKN